MSRPTRLEQFLATDPQDAGCAGTFDVIDVFADLAITRADAASRYPGVAVHLAACPACSQDLQGLLAAADCIPPGPG